MKVLDKLKELTKTTTDTELSNFLGMSMRTVGTWRNRGAVPEKVLREWSIKFGKPLEWFTDETIPFRKKDCIAPPAEPMSMDAMDKIVALLPYPVKQLVQLMEYNGIRRTEAFTIRSEDADKDGRYIRIWGKGGKWRIAPIEEPELVQSIIEAKKARPDGYLFPHMRNGKFHGQPYKDIRKTLKAAALEAGITQRVYNHLFRHSFATALAEEGENMAIIQELMGHADIKQTREYTKITSSHTRRGAARLIDRNVANVNTDQSQW